MTITRLTRLATFALCASLLVAACGSDSTEIAAEDDASVRTRTVTLMTHDSFAVSDDVLATFAEATGIEIELLPSGDAVSALNQAILTKDKPLADVFFGVDNNVLTRALDADLFLPYEARLLGEVDDELVLDPEHRVTPIDVGDVCLNVDRSAYDDGVGPTTLDDLIEPEYENHLVVENPATSTPGLAFLLATVAEYGEDGYLDYWSQLRDNGVSVVEGWDAAYYGQFTVGSSGEGSRPIVVSYASSPAAEVVFAAEPLDEAPTLAPLDTCYRQIEYAGILSGTDDEAAAREVIDFLLSDAFQADIPENMFVFPVRDVDLPASFVEHAAIAPEPYALDPALVDEKRDEWIEAWTAVVLR